MGNCRVQTECCLFIRTLEVCIFPEEISLLFNIRGSEIQKAPRLFPKVLPHCHTVNAVTQDLQWGMKRRLRVGPIKSSLNIPPIFKNKYLTTRLTKSNFLSLQPSLCDGFISIFFFLLCTVSEAARQSRVIQVL